jgi:hypothetical protein
MLELEFLEWTGSNEETPQIAGFFVVYLKGFEPLAF